MNPLKHLLAFTLFLLSQITPGKAAPMTSDKTAHDFTFEALADGKIALSDYKGKVLLVVNTASKCGFTPQYKGLQALYEKYREQGLVIIGVPSNDFGGQEPGTEEEIKSFCELNYGVTFPMTAKYAVSGDEAHPFYRWAREVLGRTGAPQWNFHKYLVDKRGHLRDYFSTATKPDSTGLQQAIDKLLAE